jgi:phosphoglycerate dehydrogenase-like enzyme
VRVVVLDDYQGVALEMADWSVLGEDCEVVSLREHLDDVKALARALAGAQVVVAMRERTPIDEALLARLDDLELIVTTGPSNAAIDVAAARARNVEVCGTGGYIEPTVELTWALILSLARHVPTEVEATRSGRWQVTVGSELKGKTLGLVGLGRIGTRVARVAQAFEMEVVAWSQNLTEEDAEATGCRRVNKRELFATADVVSIHLVLSDRTRGIVGADELAAMKPTAVLVNTARGPLVDEAALVDALESGRIAGAGLDVFDVEPLPLDHPFRRLPSVVATPHIGYVTTELYELFFREIVEDIAALIEGPPIRRVP